MDSYRPSRDTSARPIFQFGRDAPNRTGRDSYRPADFSFRAQHSNAPDFHAQPPAISGRQNRQHASRDGNLHTKSNTRTGNRRTLPRGGRRPFQPRPKVPVAERPLLRGGRSVTPEQYEGMNGGPAKFKTLEESEVDSIPVTATPDKRSEEPPRKKLAAARGSSVPKWSNPDPYTALPPPEESTGIRTDVVSLIRKARSDAAKDRLAASEGEDFISFELGNEDNRNSGSDNDSTQVSSIDESSNHKIQQRFSHLDNLHPDRFVPGTKDVIKSINTIRSTASPPPESTTAYPVRNSSRSALNGAPVDVWPPPPPSPSSSKQHLKGLSRKRHYEVTTDYSEVGEDPRASRRPHIRRRHAPPGFEIGPPWSTKPSEDPTPWCSVDHSDTEVVGHRLHKEICDFYEYVKPRHWEHDMRNALIRRTAQFVNRVLGSGAELRYFGSFAAGVYLPNADMDLVILSQEFRERRTRAYGGKNMVFNFARALRNRPDSVAKSNSVAPIPGAKVPIVKYVDRLTGIHVDVSFDNDTGVIANHTYAQWKLQYPCMPVLVTLVKQFLQMRDLNDVSTGGLGGFSTTCLVVSLLQHLPQIQGGDMSQMSNLGELFMTFLDFYGNKFNLQTTGIRLSPPGYFIKHKNRNIKVKKDRPYALCVIDPNREDNDLTGGTRHSKMIFDCFAHAFAVIQDRLADIKTANKSQRMGSVLGCLFAGSYNPFEMQRSQLWQINQQQ